MIKTKATRIEIELTYLEKVLLWLQSYWTD